jgi:carbonic anhydrase/acetyltransferase-like protein (isoleucine patch superfamily)
MANHFPQLEAVFEQSEFLAAVDRIRKLSPRGTPVSEDPHLQQQLEAAGCWAADWSRVRVAEGFSPHRVAGVKFFGDVVLGRFTENALEAGEGVVLPAGVYHSVVCNCVIEDDALVHNVGVLSNYVVGRRAVVMNNKTVSATPGTAFGNGVLMSIAIETGGREVPSYAELTIPVAAKVAKSRDNKELLAEYADFVGRYVEAARSPKGIIEEGAKVLNSAKIVNAYVGPYAVVDGATKISEATLLSGQEERTEVSDGAWVMNSILQWGCLATSMAIVDSSVCTEHSYVERHGKVTQSILGPNTGVAEGEVTASLCGPFVGFHHQALLIAAVWPEGRGNVSYGANVGSNHMSRAPDQEIWPGEGTFFGLGTDIRFPSNFTNAPYSILATAVSTLPQKVDFPFSLINAPAAVYPGISPAYNELMPAWVLDDSIYTVKRNEGKYAKRNKARRTQFIFEVFRPDIVDLMIEARRRLQEVREIKDFYTDEDIEGVGKNYVTERCRKKAIEAYGFYIRYYALNGLKKNVEKTLADNGAQSVKDILAAASSDPRWEHERKVLAAEFPGKDVRELLKLLMAYQEKVANDVQVSKEKDDRRGVRTIPDYVHAHVLAADDGFVKETWEATRKLKADVEALLARL